jgi:hypothetical protein
MPVAAVPLSEEEGLENIHIVPQPQMGGENSQECWKRCRDVAEDERRERRDAALWAQTHRAPVESLEKEHRVHKRLLTSWWDERIAAHTKQVETSLEELRVSITFI